MHRNIEDHQRANAPRLINNQRRDSSDSDSSSSGCSSHASQNIGYLGHPDNDTAEENEQNLDEKQNECNHNDKLFGHQVLQNFNDLDLREKQVAAQHKSHKSVYITYNSQIPNGSHQTYLSHGETANILPPNANPYHAANQQPPNSNQYRAANQPPPNSNSYHPPPNQLPSNSNSYYADNQLPPVFNSYLAKFEYGLALIKNFFIKRTQNSEVSQDITEQCRTYNTMLDFMEFLTIFQNFIEPSNAFINYLSEINSLQNLCINLARTVCTQIQNMNSATSNFAVPYPMHQFSSMAQYQNHYNSTKCVNIVQDDKVFKAILKKLESMFPDSVDVDVEKDYAYATQYFDSNCTFLSTAPSSKI